MSSSSSLVCSAYEEHPQRLASTITTEEDETNLLFETAGSMLDEDVARILPPPLSWFEDTPEAAYRLDDEEEDVESVEDEDVRLLDSFLSHSDLAADDDEHPVMKYETNQAIAYDRSCNNSSTPIAAATVAVRYALEPQRQPPARDGPDYLFGRTHVAAAAAAAVGSPLPSPSWREISQRILPAAARELLGSSVRRLCHRARLSYAGTRWQYSDYGNSAAGYFRQQNKKNPCTPAAVEESPELVLQLPPFSSLPWVDRQMVKEWRTYLPDNDEEDQREESNNSNIIDDDDEELEFDRARTLVPMPAARPVWKMAEACMECHKTFGPARLRHHCRLCGGSYCQRHSAHGHKLPHLGYHPEVPERVCDGCKRVLLDQNLAERIAWRMARCRDYEQGRLQPYFDVGLDSMDQMALRITQAALAMAKAIPLGAQATVAVETVDVLRKYGLNGIYTIMLRQEFLAAADLLLKALGINRSAWPLSVHELSAAIFYALAQHRAMRGMNPEREHIIHAIRETSDVSSPPQASSDGDANLGEDSYIDGLLLSSDPTTSTPATTPSFVPVCHALPNHELTSLIFYAPIALNFVYVEKEVDMQLLAAQQGWRLVYAYLDQADVGHMKLHDRPASALFVHDERKIACLAVRGTSTIHDVITDIRQVPVPFPDLENTATKTSTGNVDEDWTTVFRGHGLAVAGMAGAAVNLYREHIDSLLQLAKQGYRIRMTGHSLGGSVAVLLGVLVYKDLLDLAGKDNFDSSAEIDAPLRVYSYGTPSCVDLPLSEAVESFVTTVVLHDDVVPRLTPTSCRGLLKHLLHIRETWVKAHFADDIRAFTDRAKTAWAPRWRPGFTLSASSSIELKRYCRKQLQYGKKQLRLVKDKLVGDDQVTRSWKIRVMEREDDYPAAVTWQASPEPASIASVGETTTDAAVSSDEPEPRLVLDFIGGMEAGSEGMVVDGDEFFDPGDRVLDSSVDGSDTTNDIIDESLGPTAWNRETKAAKSDEETVPSSLYAASFERNPSTFSSEKSEDVEDDDSPGAVILEEIPLPRMFIPGKIVHIYSHRGVYRAACVPRSFRELRRISLAGNMLSDHKTKSYYDALLEVANVRRAEESPPQWTAYDEDDTCSCCASRFTWASTSDNEAQEARDKHNCRSCGSLVCDPCARNRIPVPSIGLIVAVRVCDRCYNDMDGLLTTSERISKAAAEPEAAGDPGFADKPVRHRQKRSVVVDELASRVQASGLTCN